MKEDFSKLKITDTAPTFYDGQAVTILELASLIHGKLLEVINNFNSLVDSVDKTISDFTASTNTDLEAYKTAMRQEFQDFIDIVDLKLLK